MKNIQIYDNDGKTFDRVTIVFTDQKENFNFESKRWVYNCLGCSETGSGFFQHLNAILGPHLGKKVQFQELHPELRQRLTEYFKN